MIRMWLLVIQMSHGYVEQGFFIERDNCIKMGKEIVGKSKYITYECKRRKVKIK